FLSVFDVGTIRWVLRDLEMFVALVWGVYPVLLGVAAGVLLVVWRNRRKGAFWSPLTVFLVGLAPPLLLTLALVFAVMIRGGNSGPSSREFAVSEMLNVALSPPASLFQVTFYEGDWTDTYSDLTLWDSETNLFGLKMAAAGTGLTCYALAAFVLW